jgi:hypothetical protein
VPPAADSPPTTTDAPSAEAPPATEAPPAVDAPPAVVAPLAVVAPPAVVAPLAVIAPAAANVPPAVVAPLATDAPPSADALAAAEAPPATDAPPATEAPPATDALPIANAPLIYRKPRGVAPMGADGVPCTWDWECGGWRHADGAWHSGNRLPADPRIAAAVALKDAATRVNGHAFGCSSALGFSGATNPFASATSGSETARAFCCTSALGRTGATDPFASADADFGFRGPDSASGFPAAAEPSSSAPKLMQRHRSTTVSTACRPAAPPPLLPLHASRSSAPAAARASSPLADIPINTSGSGVGAFAKPRGPVPVDSHSEKCSWDGSCGVWRDSTGAEHEQYQVDRKRKAEQSLARHVKEGSVSLCYPRASCDVFGNMYLARKVAACRGTGVHEPRRDGSLGGAWLSDSQQGA